MENFNYNSLASNVVAAKPKIESGKHYPQIETAIKLHEMIKDIELEINLIDKVIIPSSDENDRIFWGIVKNTIISAFNNPTWS